MFVPINEIKINRFRLDHKVRQHINRLNQRKKPKKYKQTRSTKTQTDINRHESRKQARKLTQLKHTVGKNPNK